MKELPARIKDPTIYTVTTLNQENPAYDKRIQGWFSNVQDAEALAQEEFAYDCRYNFAVVEEVPEGKLQISRVISWWRYNDDGSIEKTTSPFSDNVFNFGIG